jgi:hypothetical protein
MDANAYPTDKFGQEILQKIKEKPLIFHGDLFKAFPRERRKTVNRRLKEFEVKKWIFVIRDPSQKRVRAFYVLNEIPEDIFFELADFEEHESPSDIEASKVFRTMFEKALKKYYAKLSIKSIAKFAFLATKAYCGDIVAEKLLPTVKRNIETFYE